MTITPAMKKWCRAIASGGTLTRTLGMTGQYRMSGVVGMYSMTYVMGMKLTQAGLIEWIDIGGSYPKHAAKLTKVGKRCIDIGQNHDG